MKKNITRILFIITLVIVLILTYFIHHNFISNKNGKAFLWTNFGMTDVQVKKAFKERGIDLISLIDFQSIYEPKLEKKLIFPDEFGFISSEDSNVRRSVLILPPIKMFKSNVVAEFNFEDNYLVYVDVVVFPLINVAVFGFLSLYLSGKTNPENAYPLLVGMILWQLLYITQYSISVGSLWSIWSRNLSNLFLTPISLFEYNIAFIISGSLKALIVFFTSSLLSIWIFNLNIYQFGVINLLFFFINLLVFGISTGLIILGLIFRFGTRIQALAWSVTFLFQPLTAAFFPVSVLPMPLQKIAYLFPATYVFEAARYSLSHPGIVVWDLSFIALGQNIFYLVVASFLFKKMFNKSRETGQFARNEG